MTSLITIHSLVKHLHFGCNIVFDPRNARRDLDNCVFPWPILEMLDIAYVNNVGVIAKNPKMTAINSAIEVDLTGQVCSDSIGTRMYSGSSRYSTMIETRQT